MDRNVLENRLVAVGEEAMLCERKCEGVRRVEMQCSPTAQTVISGNTIGCVVVGLAPLRNRRTTTSGQRNQLGSGHCAQVPVSFSKLQAFCAELGLKDSFIWTSLCKCERIKGEKLPPETMKACAQNFLAKELELVERSVPIIALGNRVFDTIRRCFPDRFVLNIPSPDGPRGDFQETIGNKRLLDLAKKRVITGKPGSLCLCPTCARKYFADQVAS